jgi:predicted small lipoprotein YifL
MRFRPFVPVLVAASLLLALAGCGSTGAGPTVSADKVAATAARALEAKVGTKPDIDCGSHDIIVVKGKKITCELTDTDGLSYDVAVTFASVTGSDYRINVKVADAPNNAPHPTATADTGGAPTVPGTDIAVLAASALAGELGFSPRISCADSEVPIVVGGTESCRFSDSEGADHAVTVTITEFDGSHYTIDAKVVS